MIIKRKPFSELWPNACSCVGFTICAFGQVTLCTVYTLHFCPLVVICLPLGLLKFFLFINSDLLQLVCRSSSTNTASHLLTAVKDFQKWMEPYLAAFWGSFKVLSLQVHSQDIKRTELHYKAFSTCSRPWKTKDAGCLCAFSMLLSLFTGTSYSPLFQFVFIYVAQGQYLSCDFCSIYSRHS